MNPNLRILLQVVNRCTDEANVERIGNAYAMLMGLPEGEKARVVAELVAAWLARNAERPR